MFILDESPFISANLLDDYSKEMEVKATVDLLVGACAATGFNPAMYCVDDFGFDNPYSILAGVVPTVTLLPKVMVWVCSNYEWVCNYLLALDPRHPYLRYFQSAIQHMPKPGFGIINPEGNYFKTYKEAIPYYEKRLFDHWKFMFLIGKEVTFDGVPFDNAYACQVRYGLRKKELKLVD